MTEVMQGLEPAEKVASSGTFLIDCGSPVERGKTGC